MPTMRQYRSCTDGRSAACNAKRTRRFPLLPPSGRLSGKLARPARLRRRAARQGTTRRYPKFYFCPTKQDRSARQQRVRGVFALAAAVRPSLPCVVAKTVSGRVVVVPCVLRGLLVTTELLVPAPAQRDGCCAPRLLRKLRKRAPGQRCPKGAQRGAAEQVPCCCCCRCLSALLQRSRCAAHCTPSKRPETHPARLPHRPRCRSQRLQSWRGSTRRSVVTLALRVVAARRPSWPPSTAAARPWRLRLRVMRTRRARWSGCW